MKCESEWNAICVFLLRCVYFLAVVAQFVGHGCGPLERQKQDSHVYRKTDTLPLILSEKSESSLHKRRRHYFIYLGLTTYIFIQLQIYLEYLFHSHILRTLRNFIYVIAHKYIRLLCPLSIRSALILLSWENGGRNDWRFWGIFATFVPLANSSLWAAVTTKNTKTSNRSANTKLV